MFCCISGLLSFSFRNSFCNSFCDRPMHAGAIILSSYAHPHRQLANDVAPGLTEFVCLCRSLTSSSVSNGRRSQESCCIQLGELAAETALQDLTSQQQADSLCYVSPIKDHAEMQLQRLMSPAYAAESMLMAVSDSSQFQKPAAMQNSVRPADWLMTRHCSLPMQR